MSLIFLRDTNRYGVANNNTPEDSKTAEKSLWMATESKHMLDLPLSPMNFLEDQTLQLSIATHKESQNLT
jgi:hypothetical protein